MAAKPPPWENLDADDNGLAALYFHVQDRLDLPDNKELKNSLLFSPSGARPKKPKVDLATAFQKLALKEAKIGNRHRLADLVWNFKKADKPPPAAHPEYRYQPPPLSDEVRQFIAKFLVKPSAGKGRRGRPSNPEHQLNNQRIKRHVEVLQILLKRDYPEQSDVEIKDRAIDLVHASFSENSDIERDTIANLFIKKSNKKQSKT